MLAFTIEARPLERVADESGTLRPPKGTVRQPNPETWWGCSFDSLLSPVAEAIVRRLLPPILDSWWRSPLDRLRSQVWLSQMLVDLMADRLLAEPTVSGDALPAAFSGAVAQACYRALSYPRSMRSVADLAEFAGCSRQHLTRVFREAGMVSPAHWLRQRRLESARRSIEHGSRSLAVIAEDLGFADASQLSRQFHREFGQPPSLWRRQRHSGTA
jgi:AraC-like DNA-binding protein